jgi:transposase-like protein
MAQERGTAMGKRKQHTAAFKAQVALAAVKGDRTINELAGQYGVHPTLIFRCKSDGRRKSARRRSVARFGRFDVVL